MVKQGVDVDRDVYKLRNEPAAERAAIWQALAQIEVNPKRQVDALSKSVKILEEDPALKSALLGARLQLVQQQVNTGTLSSGESRTALEQLTSDNWAHEHPQQRSVDLQCQLISAQLAGSASAVHDDFETISQRARELLSAAFAQVALSDSVSDNSGTTPSRTSPKGQKGDDSAPLAMPRLAAEWLTFDFAQLDREVLEAHLPTSPAVFWLLASHIDRAFLHNCFFAAVLPLALLKALAVRGKLADAR